MLRFSAAPQVNVPALLPEAVEHKVLGVPRPFGADAFGPAVAAPEPLVLFALGTQPRLLAGIVPAPVKSLTWPTRFQPALLPRRSVTVAVCRLPVALPPTVPPVSTMLLVSATDSVNAPGATSVVSVSVAV